MRLTKIFNSASTAMLLFGSTLTTRTSGTSGDQENHTFKTKERKEATATHDTDAAKIRNIRTGLGTAATPTPPVASVSAASILVGVHDNTIKASLWVHEVFAALPHLMTGNTVWKPSSGRDTSTATPLTTVGKVSTDLAGDLNQAQDDTPDEEFRWTRFDQGAPPPIERFVDRFFTALLYVAHVINAEHIRALLYGRKWGRYRRRRRYRLTNPNSRRNRRLRLIWRVNADLDRMLLGTWAQMISTASSFFGGGPEGGVESWPSTFIQNTAAVPVLPLPSVPVAHWPPIADSGDILHPASLLAVLTPLETPQAPWLPLSSFSPAAALTATISLEPRPAAPLIPPGLPVAPLRRQPTTTRALVIYQAPMDPWAGRELFPSASVVRAAIPLEQVPATAFITPVLPVSPLRREPTVTRAIVPYQTPANLWAGLDPVPPISVVGAATLLEQLPAGPFIATALPDYWCCWEPDIARAIVPYQAPAHPWSSLDPVPPAAAVRALEQLPVEPFIAPALPVEPLHWEPDMTRAIVPYQAPANPRAALDPVPTAAPRGAAIALEQLPVAPLIDPTLPVAPLRQEPTSTTATVCYQAPVNLWAGLEPFPPASVVEAAIPLEQVPTAPSIVPALRLTSFRWQPDVTRAIIPYQASADPWRGLNLVPPAAAAPATIALEQLPAVPLIAPGLPVAPLRREATATRAIIPLDVADPVDAVDWSSIAKTFAVMDLDESDGMTIPTGGWKHAIKADVELLSVEACPLERSAVRWILTEAVELYPFTGYAQGSDHAALAIYRGMRGDKESALRVFVHWASPAAWFQRSTVDGQAVLLEKGVRHSWKVLRKQSPTAHTWLEDETMDALYAEIFLSAVSSLCTCQGLPRDVVHCLIQKTLKAGNNGPAVSLWVVHSLLATAESDCKRKMDATPDVSIRTRLKSAGKTMTSFEDLERHAPMSLSSFVNGYAAAVFGKVRLLF